ncbi:hypothetical protein Emag_005691 [Eimeria magna]
MDFNRFDGPSGSSVVNEDSLWAGEDAGSSTASEDVWHGSRNEDVVGSVDRQYGQTRQERQEDSRRFKRLALVGLLTAAIRGCLARLQSKRADSSQGSTGQADDTAGSGESTINTQTVAGPPVEEGGGEKVEAEGAKKEVGGKPGAAEVSEGEDEDKSGQEDAEKEAPEEAGLAKQALGTMLPAERQPVDQQEDGTAEPGEEGEGSSKPRQTAVEESERKEAAGGTKPEAGQQEEEAGKEEPLVEDEGTSGEKDVKEVGLKKRPAKKKLPLAPPAEEKPLAEKKGMDLSLLLVAAKDLIDTLTEVKFDTVYKVDKDDLASVAHYIQGPRDEAVPVDGHFVLREHLLDFEPGQMLDISTLHVYSQRIAVLFTQ